MSEIPPNVGSYRDRHGKTRWRYRKGTVTVSLPGQPGDDSFNAALTNPTKSGRVRIARTLNSRIELRREATIEHYCKDALRRARERVRVKGLPFKMSPAEFREMMISQNFRCAVSRIAFPLERVGRFDALGPFRPSLDRIEPIKGYVHGNVRIVCEIANLAMNGWGEEALLILVEAMANRVANRHG